MCNEYKMVIAAILTVAALTGIFSTNPMAAYAEGDDGGDSSETGTEQKLKQKECRKRRIIQ